MGKLRRKLRDFNWLRMSDLMKRRGCYSFLIDFGLREYHFGLFQALTSHHLQLITALDEVIKLVDIRVILFLDLTDLPRNVSEPHLHPLHLEPSTFLSTCTSPFFLRMAQPFLLTFLTDHPQIILLSNMEIPCKELGKRGLLVGDK